jgi:hypothetical protein
MSPNGVCVKGNEDDVIKFSPNKLQAGVGKTHVDRFAMY